MTLAAVLSSVLIGLAPQIPHRDGLVRAEIHGLDAPTAQIRLGGGLASGGHWFGWVPLQGGAGGRWSALLRAPGFLGVYPVQVRAGGHVTETGQLVKILPPGFVREPAFFTPAEVADWWARRLPTTRVLSTSIWRTGFFTHRDARYNLLLETRVEIDPYGARTVYVSMARLRPNGAWRLLETTTAP